MTRKRLRVSKSDGRRYRYPYPVYYRPPLRWITPTFSAKRVTFVARDFGPEILRAIHHNDLEFLQRILEKRLRANSLITKLCTMDVSRGAASRRVSCPLIVASQKKDPTILRYMLEKGADPNYVEYTSHRPHSYCALHTASKLGLLETAETLLCFKANPNAVDSRGETPLHIAVRTCNCALAKLLLSYGADPNARDARGCTSLHIATSHGHLEMVSLLLSYSADLKLPNRNGALPVHIAASAGHAHLVKALFVMDAASANAACLLDGNTQMPLHLAAEKGHVEVVTTLLDFRANVNAKDSAGNTALHRVVLKPYRANTMTNMEYFFATALALIKAGISVNEKNNHGETALELAASNQFPRVAKLILSSAGTELHLEPEMLQQILLEQNIVKTKNEDETTKGKHAEHLADTSSKHLSSSNGKAKSFPAEISDVRNRLEHKEQEAPIESHPLKEIQSNVADSHQSASPAQAPDVFTKRYPLPKSDLRNYQQFRPSPTIENEISTFTVTANKGAERMCILFDKNSPSDKRAANTKKGTEFRPYTQKKSISTAADVAKPASRRLKSTEEIPRHKVSLGQSLSSPEQKQLAKDETVQKPGSSQISPLRSSDLEADESVEKHKLPVTDESEEEEESCWITCKVEKDKLQFPVVPKDIRKHSAPSFRRYSKSPSGFLSEGGGLRGLRLRVAGEVPKAYTCKQKAAKRRAFILAHPVGIESTGDFDRTHLSISSLPEMGGLAWEKAMQRRLEWTEPLKPVFTKRKTPSSSEFSPTLSAGNLNPCGSKQAKGDYRITGLFPQPYRSFGKIETKTDAIEDALKDYDSEEEYQSENDVEPLTKQWVSEVTEYQWHLIPSELAEQLNTSTDDVERVNVLDESINESISSVEADEIAGIISNGYIVGMPEDDKNLDQHLTDENEETEGEHAETEEDRETEKQEEKGEHEELAQEENKQKSEVEIRNQENAAQSQATLGKSGGNLLHLLHGYRGKGASEGLTMVASNMQPEIQRLTMENIVLADDSTSDDQEGDETSDRTSYILPKQLPVNDFSELGKGDTSKQHKGNDREMPVNESALEHKDKEMEEMLRSTEAPTSDRILAVGQQKVHHNQRQEAEDKENEVETGEEVPERKDILGKPSKVSSGADGEEPEKEQKLYNEERLSEGENVEEPKKGKKGKQSSKKQKIAAKDSGEHEDVVGEVIQGETLTRELPVKRKKKSKGKVQEKELFVEEPELKTPSQNEETAVTKDVSKSRITSILYDGDAIDEDLAHNVYAEEPTRRRRKTEENLITEHDDQTVQKELRGKEQTEETMYKEQTEETMYNVYSEEPGRRGRKDKDIMKVRESEKRRGQSQDHIAEDDDSEQLSVEKENTIDIRVTPRELKSGEKEVNVTDVEYSHHVYDEEPGSRRRPSKEERASERGKDQIPDHIKELENDLERLSQDEFASDNIPNKIKKAKLKPKKGKDISLRKYTAEQEQTEATDKAEENYELQQPSELKPSGKRKPTKTQKEATIPAESEFSETCREVVETVVVEDSEYRGKPDKKKPKKKVKGKVDGFIEQHQIKHVVQEENHDHSVPVESLCEQNNLLNVTYEVGDEDSTSAAIKKQDGTSFENLSVSMGEESRLIEPINSRDIKAKKPKKTVVKDVVLNNNWGINSAVHSEVWQEAMNEEPLASSETVYDMMHLTDAEKAKAQKKAKKKSALSKKQKIIEAETITVDDAKDKSNSEQQVSFPVKTVKETDIDDKLGDMEYDSKTSHIAGSLESQNATDERKTAECVRVTMETSVDDIMDELVESKDDMTSSDVEPIKAELGRKWHRPTETNIDDLGELSPHPEADDAEPSDSQEDSKVERSLETNVDEYTEEPFVRKSTRKSNKAPADIEKSHPLNLRDTVESKASKVTNIDEYQVVPTAFGVEIKLKQPDSRFSHMAGIEETVAPAYPERLEAVESQKRQRHKKGMQKKTTTVARDEQTTAEGKQGVQSEVPELQNTDENRVADSKEEEITREEKVKQTKEEEELNEVTLPESKGAEEIEKVRRKKKKQKPITVKVIEERAEGNLGVANEQTKMQKKKASEAAYEDTKVDEETKIVEDKHNVKIYPQKREHPGEAPLREIIDEDMQIEDEEEKTEIKESGHNETITDEEDLDDEDKQKILREQIIKVKRFGEDSSLSEESCENLQKIVDNVPKTFKIGTSGQRKMDEKSLIKKEKPQTEMGSDDNFGEIKRRKKTRKPVVETTYKETGIDEDLHDIKKQEKQQVKGRERADKETEADEDMDEVRIYPQKREHVRGAAMSKTIMEEGMQIEDEEEKTEVKESGHNETDTDEELDDKDKQKTQREQKTKIKRFGEDSSLSEESYEKLQQNVENDSKTFKIGTGDHRKTDEKSVIKKEKPETEMGSDDNFGEIKRRKKIRKPVAATTYKETGIDEDLDDIKKQEEKQKLKGRERGQKETEADEDMDEGRMYPQKREHVRGAAISKTIIDEDMQSEDEEEKTEVKESGYNETSTDEEDLDDEDKQKILREQIIKVKRFGEDSTLSEESYEDLQKIVDNVPKTFKIGTGGQRKMDEKSVIKKEKPGTEMGSDDNFGEIKRRKKTRKPVAETTYKETGIDEDLDDIKKQDEKQKVKGRERGDKETEADEDMDEARIYPQKQEHVRGAAISKTIIDEDMQSEDEEEKTEVKESGYNETDTDEDLGDEDKQKIQKGQIIKVKRFGEDSSLSEESYEKLQQSVEDAPKTFKIGIDAQKKMLEKSAMKKENLKPESEIGIDEDFGEIKRRKKTRKQIDKTPYRETSIDEDLEDIKEQEKNQIAKGKDYKETSLDEDFDDDAEMNEVKPKELINIRKSGEDVSLNEEIDDEVQQYAKNATRTFKIGTDSKKEMERKLANKTSRLTPDTAVGIDEDYSEIKRLKKTRKPFAETTYRETGIDEDLDEVKIRKQDEEIPFEETEEYYKIPAQRITRLQRFKEDSSFSEESDDNLAEGAENVPKSLHSGTEFLTSGRQKTQQVVATKQKELNSRERNADHFRKAESKSTAVEEEDWTDEESEAEEEAEQPASEILDRNRRTAKELASKLAFERGKYKREQQEEYVSDHETSNKEVESADEEAQNLEYKKRIKAVHVSRERPADRLNFASITQNNEIASETNFDHLSESEDSDEHHNRVAEKVEALLSKKKSFNVQEFDLIEQNKVQTPDIASFMATDDDLHYKKSTQKEKMEKMETSDTVAKKQQRLPRNALETEDSEEVAGSFSRRQIGRVSRGRVKKGTKKTQDPTLEPPSNADAKGGSKRDSYEDSRIHSAEISKGKKWCTEETEITETKLTSQQGQKTRQSTLANQQGASDAQKSTPSAAMASSKLQDDAEDKISQQTQPSIQPSRDLDLDESIRRKRQMEMSEVVTKTVKTSAVQDNHLSEKATEDSSYSLPSPTIRKPPQKRDIKPLNTSAPLPQETSFDVELSPAPKSALDIRLSDVTPSKSDPFKRNSVDVSLLRKSTTTERTFQQRAPRQHSVDSLNRHRPRSQSNEFGVKKFHSDANLSRRKRHSIRSRSTGHIDLRSHYNGMYRSQREQVKRPLKFKQPDKTLQQVAFETITASAFNEPRLLKKRQVDDAEKQIVYTRGIYRPQPVYWRGASHGANAHDESRISARQAQEQHSLNESTEDAADKTTESLDKSKQNGNTDSYPSSPPQLSMSKDGDDLENRNSAFATYNKRVTIHEEERPQQFYYGRRRHKRPRTMRPSREEPYKAPQITEPIAVDFSKYGILAQLWMEQVDMKTVLKSKTMYLSIMPAGVQPPEEIMKSIKYVPTAEDLTLPAQWIIARGRSIRQQKRQMDEYHQRMSESYVLSGGDSDLDLTQSANPMSPGKQSLLFFKVGGRWPDLAWVLFEGVQNDAATIRMIKDIQLKNADQLTDQIQDLMSRWWKQKGGAATIEELKRSLELINLPFVQDETLNIKMANSFFNTSDLENKLACEEVGAADPEVSRMIQEYNQRSHNASFSVEPRKSPQAFSSDALLRQAQQKGLLTHSTLNLKPGDNRDSSLGRNDSQDGSFIRLHSRNESIRIFSSQDSLNMENTGEDNKRKSFMIVQPQLKKPIDKKFRHESNI